MNRKYSCIKPENMSIGVRYSFSINPEKQPSDMKSINNIVEWYNYITKQLALLKYCSVVVALEISCNGRLHYHGYITIENIIDFFYEDIKRLQLIGAYEIDTVEDVVKWDKYINKLEKLMEQWCKKHNIERVICTMDKTQRQSQIMVKSKDVEDITDFE